ncbi:MAG: NifB/NifX family molybdenum-iron cluster-binding protein [Syntrophomonadaceae bacterium]|jgi:predicted DNA-binding protein (UPF0251 family)/predicted Fe-Mo cluster-binding NifX family protein
MPREPRCRRVDHIPRVNLYKPQGVPYRNLPEVILKIEELEAIRLKDLLRLEQEECAEQMQISRPTFQRILNEARYKIASALTNGYALRIAGGNYCLGRGFCRRYGRPLTDTETCARLKELRKDGGIMSEKIAITSTGYSNSSPVDSRFGRCNYFMIWDQDTREFESISNNGTEAAHGAGTGAVQNLVKNGVGVLITQRVGPKAFAALSQAGIKVFSRGEAETVEEALKSYEAGQLQEILAPNN